MAGNPDALKAGAGKIYGAVLGTTRPMIGTAIPVAWVDFGYTNEGFDFESAPEWGEQTVDQEKDPVRRILESRATQFTFNAAELTAINLQKAYNGGTITTATGNVTFTPPKSKDKPTRMALLWESEDEDERIFIPRAVNIGSLTISRKKGSEYAQIPFTYALEVVAGMEIYYHEFKGAVV